MPFFDSAGVEIFYRVEGQGAPIVLVHGFASNMEANWVETGWLDVLTGADRQVIMADMRGHGRSEKIYDTNAYGAHLMAEDVYRLIRFLGHERVDIMGYSMGARISAFVTINHRDIVRKAIFGGLGEAMIAGVGGAEDIAQALEADNVDSVRDPGARAFRLFAEATQSDLLALAACIRSSRVKILPEMLQTITAPVLVAVGSKDVIAGAPEPLADIIPKGEVLTIANRDHMRATGDKAFKQGVLEFLG